MKDSNRIAIIMIENSEGKILMGRRNNSKGFTQPGGHCHEGEEIIMGALRELKEETGLTPNSAELVKVHYNPEKNIFIYLYKMTLEHSVLTPLTEGWDDPDDEVSEWDFYYPNEIFNELHVPIQDNVLVKYWAEN